MRRYSPLFFLWLASFASLQCMADEMSDDFAWFGKLGYPDVKGLPFVKFTFNWNYSGTQDLGPQQEGMGFLFEDSPEHARVIDLYCTIKEVVKNPKNKDGSPATKNSIEPADLSVYVKALHDPAPKSLRTIPGHFTYPWRLGLFMLAWDCSRQGQGDLAAQLYAEAQTARGPYEGADNEAPFHHKLEQDVAEFEISRILRDFCDLRVTRAQLVAELRACAKKLVNPQASKAADLADKLEPMIAEDAAHGKLTDEQLAKLTPEEQAKEWIFRLRDYTGTLDFGGSRELEKLGDPAIPLLIEALRDERPTRSVLEPSIGLRSGWSPATFTSVNSIGAVALRSIQMIAGRNIEGEAIAQWWKERQARGELGELRDTAMRGDETGLRSATMLRLRFPDEAAKPTLAGVLAAKQKGIRDRYMMLVAQLDKETVLAFLKKEATEGPILSTRMQAAYQLSRMGITDTIPRFIELWRKSKPLVDGDDDMSPGYDEHERLIHLLALAGVPEGVKALAQGLSKRDRATRVMVVESFNPTNVFWNIDDMGGGDTIKSVLLKPAAAAAVKNAIEALLAAELEDTHENIGWSGVEGDTKIPDIRIGDYAAYVMSLRWPDRYKFTAEASLKEREKQRLACLEAWRKSSRVK